MEKAIKLIQSSNIEDIILGFELLVKYDPKWIDHNIPDFYGSRSRWSCRLHQYRGHNGFIIVESLAIYITSGAPGAGIFTKMSNSVRLRKHPSIKVLNSTI